MRFQQEHMPNTVELCKGADSNPVYAVASSISCFRSFAFCTINAPYRILHIQPKISGAVKSCNKAVATPIEIFLQGQPATSGLDSSAGSGFALLQHIWKTAPTTVPKPKYWSKQIFIRFTIPHMTYPYF